MKDKRDPGRGKGKKNKKRSVAIALSAVLFFVAVLVLTGVLVRVREIAVSGAHYYDVSAVRYRLFPEEEPRLYTVLKEKYLMPAADRELFNSCKLKMTDLHSVTIEIEELPGFCQVIREDGSCIRLDENGRILAVNTYADPRIPKILGIATPDPVLFSLSEEAGELQDAIQYIRLLKETGFTFDALEYAEETGFFIRMEEIVIRYGSADSAEEKVSLSVDQYPEIQPLSGTLHLEKYSKENPSSTIYFKVGEE